MASEFLDAVHAAEATLEKRNGDPDSFFDILPQFRDVVTSGLHLEHLNSLAAGVLANGTPVTARITSGRFIVLHTSSFTNWALIIHEEPSRYLYLSPVHAIQSVVSQAPLQLDRYRMVGAADFEHVDACNRIELVESGLAPPGQTFLRNGREDIFDIKPNLGGDQKTAKGFSLRVNSQPLEDFDLSFDRRTLAAIGSTAVDPLESNLTTIFDLLAQTGDPKSIEFLHPFTEHRLHFIRWRAVKTIGAIDPERGIEYAKSALNDSHRYVREAAQQTLSNSGLVTV